MCELLPLLVRRSSKLFLQLALSQPEEQLLARGDGDLVLVGARVQLCEERGELVVGLPFAEEVRASKALFTSLVERLQLTPT